MAADAREFKSQDAANGGVLDILEAFQYYAQYCLFYARCWPRC